MNVEPASAAGSKAVNDSGGPDLLATSAAGTAAVRGGALRFGGYALGVALGIGASALLFRHLGRDDTGRYVTVLALVAIIGGVSDAGLTAIGVRELSLQAASRGDAVMRNLLGLRIVLTGAGLAVAMLFTVLAGYSRSMVLGTVLAGIGLLFQSVQATLAISLMSTLRLGWVTLIDLLRQIVSTVLIAVLVVAGGRLLSVLAVPLVASLAMLLMTAWLVRSEVPFLPSFEPAQWRRLLAHVIPYSVAVAAGVVYFRIAILLVSLASSSAQTGYFGAAFRVVDVLVAIPQLLMIAAFPIFARAARDDRERLAYGLDRVLQVSVIVGAGMAVLLILGGPFAVSVVAGSEFHAAGDVLRVQGVAVGATFVGAVFGYALLSLHRHVEILLVNVSALALVAVLVAVLASFEGAMGAAIATALAEVIGMTMNGWVLHRREPGLFPSLKFLPRIIFAVIPALCAWLLPIPSVAQAIIGGVTYVALVVALGAVPPELRAALRHRGTPSASAA